jgi:hypothetical protein
LQIIKRFEKRDFQFYFGCGLKLSWKLSPARPAASVSPTPTWPSRGRAAQSATLPLLRSQPSAAQRPAEAASVSFLTETRPRRAHPAPPAPGRRTDPVPCLACLCLVPHPWLPRTLSPHACPDLSWIEFAGSLPTEDNENQILTDYLPILSTNPEFSWRLGSGCCCTPACAFAPINRSVRRPPERISPLPLSFPIQPAGVVPT